MLVVKKLTKVWVKEKKLRDDQDILDIEKVLASLEAVDGGGFISDLSKAHLTHLEFERIQTLKDREETWRLKSRATWLKGGYDNTKLYHKFSNGRRAINTIWHLEDEVGHKAQTFHQISNLGIYHFH